MSTQDRIDLSDLPSLKNIKRPPLKTGDGKIIEDTPEGRAAHAEDIRKMFEEFEAIWAAAPPDEDPDLDDKILKAIQENRR
ncbi:MAG: hypothetical protein U0800_19830 [Isosphaeraceae bacterium]